MSPGDDDVASSVASFVETLTSASERQPGSASLNPYGHDGRASSNVSEVATGFRFDVSEEEGREMSRARAKLREWLVKPKP